MLSPPSPLNSVDLPKAKLSVEVLLRKPESGSGFSLRYNLFDNDFCYRWFNHLLDLMKRAPEIRDGGDFYGKQIYTREEVTTDMQKVVKVINCYGKSEFGVEPIRIQPTLELTTAQLNEIHGNFEALAHHSDYLPPRASHEVANAVLALNVLVHRYENFLTEGASNTWQVEVLFQKVEHFPFQPEDYRLFTPDANFGYMYLTYGITGVPPLAAFYVRPEGPPRRQDQYTAGFTLSFRDDFKFTDWDKLDQWLQVHYGWSAHDPNSAIGYIPLGQLVSVDLAKDEYLARARENRHIDRVTLFVNNKPVQL